MLNLKDLPLIECDFVKEETPIFTQALSAV